MLACLLPFVEKRLNLLELAPKGTGKSYVFGNVSKYGLLTDGGKITRTKMKTNKTNTANTPISFSSPLKSCCFYCFCCRRRGMCFYCFFRFWRNLNVPCSPYLFTIICVYSGCPVQRAAIVDLLWRGGPCPRFERKFVRLLSGSGRPLNSIRRPRIKRLSAQ